MTEQPVPPPSSVPSAPSDQVGDQAPDQWFAPPEEERPAEYDRISAQVDQLADALAGAEPQQVGDELADLHERADAIVDPEWRDQAHTRVDELPEQVSAAEQATGVQETTESAAPDSESR